MPPRPTHEKRRNMPEIIARRENKIFLMPAFAFACAAAVFAVSPFTDNLISALFLAFFGVVFLFSGLVVFIPAIRTPSVQIARQGATLLIKGGQIPTADLTDAQCRIRTWLKSGEIWLVASGRTYRFYCVKNAVQTLEKIYLLIPKENLPHAPAANGDEKILAVKHKMSNRSLYVTMGVFLLCGLCEITLAFDGQVDWQTIVFSVSLTAGLLLITLAVFVPRIVLFRRTPEQLIVRQGDELLVKGARCKIRDVRLLYYYESFSKNIARGYGTMVLAVNGVKCRLFFVEDVTRVANVLITLYLSR